MYFFVWPYAICLSAFYLFCSEFEISYLLPQTANFVRKSDVFISLASDFDLDAAIQTASMPFLSLRVQPIALTGQCSTSDGHLVILINSVVGCSGNWASRLELHI